MGRKSTARLWQISKGYKRAALILHRPKRVKIDINNYRKSLPIRPLQSRAIWNHLKQFCASQNLHKSLKWILNSRASSVLKKGVDLSMNHTTDGQFKCPEPATKVPVLVSKLQFGFLQKRVSFIRRLQLLENRRRRCCRRSCKSWFFAFFAKYIWSLLSKLLQI